MAAAILIPLSCPHSHARPHATTVLYKTQYVFFDLFLFFVSSVTVQDNDTTVVLPSRASSPATYLHKISDKVFFILLSFDLSQTLTAPADTMTTTPTPQPRQR